MKKLIIVLVLSFSHSILSQWFIVSSVSNDELYSLFFISNSVGIVGGNQDGLIFKTSNSGVNFVPSSTGTGVWFLDIYFFDRFTGWACGQNGRIIKTTTGGDTWSPVFQASNFLHSIRFADANTGYAVGYGNLIYKSTNGGNNWSFQPNPFPPSTYLLGTHFINANTGFVCGRGGLIGRTTNGGQLWQLVSTGFEDDMYEEVVFTDANTGYIAGNFGTILKSTNAGLNWTQQNTGIPEWLHDAYFINNNTGWACGIHGKIIHTVNGGANWVSQNVPTTSLIRAIHFPSRDTGYAVTDAGILLKTHNAGNPIGINQIGTEIPKEFSLFQNYPNPFNPSTKIKFSLPKSSNVTLNMYDNLGRGVAILIDQHLTAGTYEYDFNASVLSSGIYFYRIKADDFVETKKMILVK